jgi:hypothetical protein
MGLNGYAVFKQCRLQNEMASGFCPLAEEHDE